MDKKENELNLASNFEWVRALDASGNSIRINKADVAKVLGGLMNINHVFYYQRSYDEIKASKVTTDIKVNAGYERKAILYLASSHLNSGDSTQAVFGLIRFGFDGNFITNTVISGEMTYMNFAVSPDGFLEVKFTNGASNTITFFG